MSYLKLPKTTQDHAVGLQSVNQAVDNNAELLTVFDLKHAIGINGNSPYGFPLRAIGRHEDMLIARSVADFEVDTAPLTPRLVGRVLGPVFGALFFTRLAVGQWQIFINSPQLFAAVALSKSTASVDRKTTCFRTSTPSTGASLIVSTWNVATAALTDLPFSLVVWTQA